MNVLIYTIGSPPESMFTYYRAFDIDKIFLTKCPGSAYHRNNVDCGFQAMVRPGVILSPAKIMGDILQYRLALNSIIWTSFAWAFTATPEKALNYVKRDRKHSPCSNLMTYGEDMCKYSGGRRNEYNTFKQYAYDRSTMFYGMFSLCSDSVTKNITPGHFMCEVLDTLWFVIDSGKSNNFVGICREESEAIRIEDGMREIFDLVSKDYIKRKNAIQEMESSSDVIKNRQERTAFLSTPIVSWETIDSWITSQTGEVQEMNAVAAYLCTKDQEIAGLAQVPTLINFYLRLHDELSYRVAKEDLSLPMKEVLRKYDGEGLLRDDWEAFKTAWATVVEAIHQEGCAGGMAERGFEFQSAAINDETLFLVLISDSNNNDDPEGEIYKMIKLGVANVQERVLEKLTTNYEKLNPNDMLFDSGTKSDFIATALNKKTPNNNALLDVRGIDYARECASLFVECDSALSRSSFSVIIPKFVIEIIRKTASGAVPMNKNESLREFLLCDFKAVDKASIDRATESRLSEQELIRSLATTMAGHLAEGGASMLRARLASFSVPKYGERLKPGWAEAELRGANEGLLNSISGVVVSLIDFAAAVERHELEDDSDVVPENLGHLERDTVDQAYEKAFGGRIPNYAVRQKIGFLEMRFLADVGAKVLRKLETHDWLFEGEKREYSVPLSRSVEAELDEIKKAVLSAADESDRKASVWCNTVEEVVRALSDRKALRQSQPLSLLYHEKQAFRDVRARSLLPERIKSSYYVGYMKWLYGLLCELKMKTVHEPSGSGKEEEHPWL